jgi:hypothetical protein
MPEGNTRKRTQGHKEGNIGKSIMEGECSKENERIRQGGSGLSGRGRENCTAIITV